MYCMFVDTLCNANGLCEQLALFGPIYVHELCSLRMWNCLFSLTKLKLLHICTIPLQQFSVKEKEAYVQYYMYVPTTAIANKVLLLQNVL